jgi:hypothetical protein
MTTTLDDIDIARVKRQIASLRCAIAASRNGAELAVAAEDIQLVTRIVAILERHERLLKELTRPRAGQDGPATVRKSSERRRA